MSTATLHDEMEKILLPKLRFQGFEGEWEKKKLGDVGKIRMCKRVFSEETSESGEIPFYKIGTFGKEADAYITNELYFNYRERFSFPKIGEILMSASGTLGRTVVYDGKPAYFQDSNIVWIDNNEKLITNSFLYYIYQIVKYDSEGGTIQRLYNSIISNTKFNRPTLPEQQKIASFLSSVDEKIQQLSRKKELLEQYKKGVMQQLFSGKLRFKDENGNNYADWEEIKLGELIEICSSKRVLQEDWKEEGVPFLRTREIINLSNGAEFRTPIYISEMLYDELKLKYGIPKNGDILVTGVGTIGEAYIVKKSDKFYFKDGNVLWFKMNEKINSMYLWQLFQTKFIKKQLSNNASITTVATFTIDGARKTTILYPCLEEQQKIANFLSSIDTKLQSTNQQITQTQSFKKGLLQQLFV